MSIYKVFSYTDDANRTVIERLPLKESSPALYIGSVIIKTEKGVFPIEFEIKEDTVEKCFEKFDDTLKAFVEEKRREAQTKIVTPAEAGLGGNVIPFPKS